MVSMNFGPMGMPVYFKKFRRGYLNAVSGLFTSKIEDPIAYVVARDGMYQFKRSFYFEAVTRIWPSEGKDLGWLGEEKERLILALPKKVPERLLQKTVEFFRRVFERHQSEAILLLYWDIRRENFKLVCPSQIVSGLWIAQYNIPPTVPDKIRLGTIHSHCDFSAFHSNIDRDDEIHEDGIHITVGNVNDLPSLKLSLVVDGARKSLQLLDVFESYTPQMPGQLLQLSAPDMDKMMDQVSVGEIAPMEYEEGRLNAKGKC